MEGRQNDVYSQPISGARSLMKPLHLVYSKNKRGQAGKSNQLGMKCMHTALCDVWWNIVCSYNILVASLGGTTCSQNLKFKMWSFSLGQHILLCTLVFGFLPIHSSSGNIFNHSYHHLPKQMLVNEHWVLFWYCNKTKNHPSTAIQSMYMCDSKILRYLFILVHM